MPKRSISVFSVFIGMVAVAPEVKAAMTFCNRTNAISNIAIMQKVDQRWISRGWYIVKQGDCADLITSLTPETAYYYVERSDGGASIGNLDNGGAPGCVKNGIFELSEHDGSCESQSARTVVFTKDVVGHNVKSVINLSDQDETVDFSLKENIDKACEVLTKELDRPSIPKKRIVLGRYSDVFTLPQTKVECVNVYDTGVPNPSACTTEIDSCASKWHAFGAWGCKPGIKTRCDNIKSCNTWATYKRTMECDIVLDLKLPDMIGEPLERFVDNSYRAIKSTQSQVRSALPLQCFSEIGSNPNPNQAMLSDIKERIYVEIRGAIEREAKASLTDAAIKTIIASSTTGGISGPVALTTSIASFVVRVKQAVDPYLRLKKQVDDFAGDIGFSTACGWSEWHRF